MQIQKRSRNDSRFFLMLLFCIFSLGCNANFQSQSLISKVNLPSIEPEIKRACYLDNCFSTVSVNRIANADSDYTYPNPEKYPGSAPPSQYIAPSFLLDLNLIDKDTKVSKHFVLSEFMRAESGQYAMFSKDVIKHLDGMREFLGKVIQITSGYRSPGHNSRVPDSAVWSRHTYGDAVDFVVPGVKPEVLVALCRDKFNSFFQKTYPDHIHCDWRLNQLDPIFYGTNGNLPMPLPTTKMNAMMYTESLAQKSEIIMASNDYSRTLTVQVPTEEGEDEEGVPTHKWSVVLPNNVLMESDQDKITIPLMAGEHRIKVVVGSTIEVERIVVW